jgi:hypothetical protein
MHVSVPNPSVRYFANLSRAPQDFDHRPCSRTPELEFVGWLTTLNSVFNIVKMLPNHIERAIAMSVDEASSGDPGNPVHGQRVGAESLRQVKLTITAREDTSSAVSWGQLPHWLCDPKEHQVG